MNWKKLTHSRCPGCKKYGLPALKTGRNFAASTVVCEHCGRSYATNQGINIIVELGSMALLVWAHFRWIVPNLGNAAEKAVLIILFLLWLLLFYVYEYFAPLHEREE